MSEYSVVITKRVENPDYEKSMADYNDYQKQSMENRYFGERNSSPPYPAKWLDARELAVTLTEDEYRAVKRAVLETFA